jgi:hypothetical protein
MKYYHIPRYPIAKPASKNVYDAKIIRDANNRLKKQRKQEMRAANKCKNLVLIEQRRNAVIERNL